MSADDLRSLLAKNGIKTVLIGAHAANRYRLEARHTADIDFLAATLDGAAATLAAPDASFVRSRRTAPPI